MSRILFRLWVCLIQIQILYIIIYHIYDKSYILYSLTAASVPGTPGDDYPIYAAPPETSFTCEGYVSGYYADTEARSVRIVFDLILFVIVIVIVVNITDSRCQAYHVCVDGGRLGEIKYTFLCPNGTLFNQNYFICDWWFNVDCSQVTNS